MDVAVVVPNWNGRRWLERCLAGLAEQTAPAREVIVVDNGSTDGSLELVHQAALPVRVIELGHNTGFAYAANRGVQATAADAVALVNTDIELAPDWIERMAGRLAGDAGLASVACKMVSLDDPTRLYDAGDFLRRDGVCEQRGRFELDRGDYDAPGEVFAACAGAALYRRDALTAVGCFDERLFSYLEDVDLGLRLALTGWRCAYEPVIARHAGGGSAWQLDPPAEHWIERNTLLVAFKGFPMGWAPQVAYRQLGWAWHALRERRLRAHLGGALSALRALPGFAADRRRLRESATVSIERAVPARPITRRPKAPGRR
jgi:hypothetical protein